jgi:hypothetical protein
MTKDQLLQQAAEREYPLEPQDYLKEGNGLARAMAVLQQYAFIAGAKSPEAKEYHTDSVLASDVKLLRTNYELWKKGDIKDGAFSWHINNMLLHAEQTDV